ncbi:MAG: type II secretion system F family protein [Eubacteriales bacterium]|nr:type II secretion system F family protein [Eubacteriales bacterium]
MKKIFYRAAYALLKRVGRIQEKRSEEQEFEVKRLAQAMMVAAAGICGAVLLQTVFLCQNHFLEKPELARPSKGEGERRQELLAQIGDEEYTEKIELLLAERKYTAQEKQELLKAAIKEIEEVLLGDNPSADEVREKVNLPEELQEGRVKVQWGQDPAGLLDEDGYIKEELEEDGSLLQLKALLDCEGQEAIYECALHLLPPVYDEAGKLGVYLKKEVEKADQESAEKDKIQLPESIDGRRIIWKIPGSSGAGICLMLTAAAAIAVWMGRKREVEKQEQRRRRQLILDYSDLLFKLSMLLNSGLTMQNTFFKIAFDYRDRQNREVRYAYEEMLAACYEMRSGIPEARAYENFGRRCQEGCYVKLGVMLSTNLQKGSEGLAKLLQELAASSMEERRQLAKKLGEEAGTRLLMPMVLMLLVVLVILMVPAVLAF